MLRPTSSSQVTTDHNQEQEILSGFSTPPTISENSPEKNLEKAAKAKAAKIPESSSTWKNFIHRNLVIGECHDDLSPKRFLIENMKLFKENGYKVIFLEHISQNKYEESLNEFYMTKNMPKELTKKLQRLDEGHIHGARHSSSQLYRSHAQQYNFTELVKAAIENDIRIIGLETSEEKWRESQENGSKNRMLDLNENARVLITAEEAKFAKENPNQKLKWICFVGSAHLKKYKGVAGICDVVESQEILISDSRGQKHEGDLANVVLDSEIKNLGLYQGVTLPVNASMAIIWSFDTRMQYEDILEFRNEIINKKGLENSGSSTKDEIYKSSSDSESERGVKRKYTKELEQTTNENPAKKVRNSKNVTNLGSSRQNNNTMR